MSKNGGKESEQEFCAAREQTYPFNFSKRWLEIGCREPESDSVQPQQKKMLKSKKGETTMTVIFAISFEMSPFARNLVKVEFQVQAKVPHGVTIRVSGSVPQLGFFSPANSIPLYTSPKEYICSRLI